MYRYIKSEKMNLEPEKVRFMCLRTVCARKHKHQSACKLLSLSGFREMTGGSNLVAASLMSIVVQLSRQKFKHFIMNRYL